MFYHIIPSPCSLLFFMMVIHGNDIHHVLGSLCNFSSCSGCSGCTLKCCWLNPRLPLKEIMKITIQYYSAILPIVQPCCKHQKSPPSITSISYTSSTSSARLQPSSPCLQDVGSKESGIEVSHHVLFCEEPGNRLGSCDVLKGQISSCFLGFISPNGLLLDGFILNDWFQQIVP